MLRILSGVRLQIINVFNELLFRSLELQSFENLQTPKAKTQGSRSQFIAYDQNYSDNFSSHYHFKSLVIAFKHSPDCLGPYDTTVQ